MNAQLLLNDDLICDGQLDENPTSVKWNGQPETNFEKFWIDANAVRSPKVMAALRDNGRFQLRLPDGTLCNITIHSNKPHEDGSLVFTRR